MRQEFAGAKALDGTELSADLLDALNQTSGLATLTGTFTVHHHMIDLSPKHIDTGSGPMPFDQAAQQNPALLGERKTSQYRLHQGYLYIQNEAGTLERFTQ